jgi:hypothetical protein
VNGRHSITAHRGIGNKISRIFPTLFFMWLYLALSCAGFSDRLGKTVGLGSLPKQEKYFTSIQAHKHLGFELQPKLVLSSVLFIYMFFVETLTILECIQLQFAIVFFTIRNHHETFERVRQPAMRGVRAYIDWVGDF